MSTLKTLKPYWMVCYTCMTRMRLSQRAARALKWRLWLGGAQCGFCVKKVEDERQRKLNEYRFR